MSNEQIHVFTSITANYLPKARVLAESVKRVAPAATFHLMLCDDPPAGFDLAAEPFDALLTLDMLAIDDLQSWIFSHSVVELCTAVKGAAVEAIFERHGAGMVFFFDPDMVLFSRFGELVSALAAHSVVLTPHQTTPETTVDAIMDNEMASLVHGVFNLGFLGVRNSEEGRRFSRWWRDRLLLFCHDDRSRGLFTDQKWVNLAPCFFDEVCVLRSPAFNVATWNISQRHATGSLEAGVFINGEPLGFFHFSGFDSGAQEVMLKKYGKASPVLFELRRWYIDACRAQGQDEQGELPSRYAAYDDGTAISRAQRILYREREDLRKAFPDPFSTAGGGYLAWYGANAPEEVSAAACAVAIQPMTPVPTVLAETGAYLRRVGLLRRSHYPVRSAVLRLAGALLASGARFARALR